MEPNDKPASPIAPTAFEPLQTDQVSASTPPRTRRNLVLFSLFIFVLALLYLFSARSVQILVTVESEVSINIGGLVLPIGERYLMLPGERSIELTAAGYYPMSSVLNIDERADQTYELTPQPLPGRLTIESQPTGADVLLDGQYLGKTPLQNQVISPGPHQLLLQDSRHLPLEHAINITGRDIQQQLSLQMQPAWADVTLDSEPAGAQLLVDGESVAKTPVSIEVLQGARQLMLQLPGYAPWQEAFDIVAGEPVELGQIQLQTAPGWLQLDSRPTAANVTLDGEFKGQTPINLALQAGKAHQLALSLAGYQRFIETVQLPAESSAEKVVELQARLGEVRFNISPAQANLWISGRRYGQGSQTLSLPAVEHSVEVSLPGHQSIRVRVTPRPGLTQQLEFSLLTHEVARVASLLPEITTPIGQTLKLFLPEKSAQPSFTLGASRREPGRRSNETLRPVSLRRMFYLQTAEVTNAQFRRFQADHDSGFVQGNSLNKGQQPAVKLSWQQAASFCNWLSAREGLPKFYREDRGIITGFTPEATGYRLPTEAEWAWAARASAEKWLRFPWGDNFPPEQVSGNYADTSSAYVTGRIVNGYNDTHVVSAPIASFDANQNGLYDMGGNVAEWIHDVYTIPTADSAAEIDPLGQQSGDNYVIRGASWSLARLPELRLAYRDYGQAGRDDVGFRIARYAE